MTSDLTIFIILMLVLIWATFGKPLKVGLGIQDAMRKRRDRRRFLRYYRHRRDHRRRLF